MSDLKDFQEAKRLMDEHEAAPAPEGPLIPTPDPTPQLETYLATMTRLRATFARKDLMTQVRVQPLLNNDDVVMTIAELVESKIAAGARAMQDEEGKARLHDAATGHFYHGEALGKAGMAYAIWLSARAS